MKILIIESSDIDVETNCLVKDVAKKFEDGGFTHIRLDGQLWTAWKSNLLGHKFIDLYEPVAD